MKKLILLSALLIFACSEGYEVLTCIDNPILSTFPATNITKTASTLIGVINTFPEFCGEDDGSYDGNTGFVYSTETQQPNLDDSIVSGSFDQTLLLVDGYINARIENLESNTTYYFRAFLSNGAGNFYAEDGVRSFTTQVNYEPTNCDIVFLDENGITIKACESANVGDVGTINGIEYTVVSEPGLKQMIDNNADVSYVCTSKVTKMNQFFYQNYEFNQDISSWDVSNVTSMSGMFEKSAFNQDISNWDVNNVTDMSGMFERSAFNQDISNWDVSNVTDMYGMFKDNSAYNQSLESWDVSSVKKMGRMFEGNSVFNQPINNWDVSSVNEMWSMFFNASNFNQPIVDWDVSSVINMYSMFSGSSFNQAIGDWDVSNVLQCDGFSYNTPQWILPQPNFTNCTP
jgi:surface protein|tara:strand:+ start:209 stop:1411 length:1203 start_codon:yes stop_codon:yes gene_type:complete